MPEPTPRDPMSAAPSIANVEPWPRERLLEAEWVRDLRASGPAREAAVARLHALLLRAARFEVGRRRQALPQLRGGDLDELAQEAADDAAVSVLRRLDDFRGESRFTTWAYKFALLEAAVKVRRRAWRDREVELEPETWSQFEHPAPGPPASAERAALLAAIQEGIRSALTPHQREVLVALALNGVPIDVLAERLGSTRNALYKTLHDARRKLRAHLEDRRSRGGCAMTDPGSRPDAAAPARPRRAGGRLRRVLRAARPLRRAGAGRRARRRARAGAARAPRRVPGLRRGAREPARTARARRRHLTLHTPEARRHALHALSDRRRRHDRRRGRQGDPRARRRRHGDASSARSRTRRTSGRCSRRGSGRAHPRRRSGARRPRASSS